MAQGGKRVPARPAAVAGPGALSRRTDGGPGSKSQPIRVPTGGAYGEAGALEAQQKGAPLESGAPRGAPAPPSGGPSAAPLAGGVDVFGPTQRPGQDPRMGTSAMPTTPMARNPQAALRVIYSKFPNPAIQRLLDTSAYGSKPPR